MFHIYKTEYRNVMDPASTKGVFEYHSVWVYIYIYRVKQLWVTRFFPDIYEGTSWLWSYSCWIYNYLCRRRILLLTLWNRIPFRWSVLDTTLWDTVCQWLATDRWFSPESSGGLHQEHWPPRHTWNIVESSFKHHKPNLNQTLMSICFFSIFVMFK